MYMLHVRVHTGTFTICFIHVDNKLYYYLSYTCISSFLPFTLSLSLSLSLSLLICCDTFLSLLPFHYVLCLVLLTIMYLLIVYVMECIVLAKLAFPFWLLFPSHDCHVIICTCTVHVHVTTSRLYMSHEHSRSSLN